MFLTWRPMEKKDFQSCLNLLADQHAYDKDTYKRIPDFWESLMRMGQFDSAVIEDQERLPGHRIVGFVTLAFPSDDFVAEVQRPGFPPYLNLQIMRHWIRGASPLLTTAQVRKANGADGVNLLFFQFGLLPEVELMDEARFLRDKLYQVCSEIGLGYNLRMILVEVYSPETIQFNLNAGMHVLSCRPADDMTVDGTTSLPCVMAALRSQPMEGTTLGPYFIHQSPVLFFKETEQQLLRRALLGESDEEAAQALDVSVSTVHKRWLAIYEQAGRMLPALFPGGGAHGTEDVKRRGLEKRRHLLLYLQSHHEELRPYPAPARKNKAFNATDLSGLTIREYAPAPSARSA